ncbi:MAG TPA: DUF1016 N-terminal domain-containing protein [Puia sp.]|nr:DUF1016 N-terminal domain-containing protein [Puia sp.]
MDKQYVQFIADLKQNIVRSRYAGARLANKEQLMLYFKTGKMLVEKVDAEKWGAKVLEQIGEDLQKLMPGLRGFSHRNLKKMKHFYAEYQFIAIGPSATAQIREVRKSLIPESATAKLQKTRITENEYPNNLSHRPCRSFRMNT